MLFRSKEYLPYRVIQIDTAEADDIIGTLCMKFGNELPIGNVDPILIISGDKDFRQLQKYSNVKQYDPVRKRWLVENNPEAYLKEHIMRGDKGDGVPNFLSSDDSIVLNTRQKPITQKKVDVWIHQEPTQFCDEQMLRGYKRNEQMVDLTLVPQNVQDSIMESYQAQAGKGREKLFNYFIENKLKNLLTDIGQF